MLTAALLYIPVTILAWQQPATKPIRLQLTTHLSAVGYGPCYWFEEPSETLRTPAPFGRAQQGVLEQLEELNWQHRREDEQPPCFTFKYPRAPTFCVNHPDILGLIRQIPRSWDDHVDDKLKMHLLLSASPTASSNTMTPPTFVVNHAFLEFLNDKTTEDRPDDGCWFLKHRLDAKRPRVHPYTTSVELHNRLQQMKEASWNYYIAQKEIHPPMLLHGRKFVLRAHVLAVVKDNTLRLYLHSNPLVLEHEVPLVDKEGRNLSALVLQTGTRSPAYLLSEALTPALRASILDQMSVTTAHLFQELQHQHPLVPDHAPKLSNDDEETVLYQLYGLDFMLNYDGQVFLLEVNRSPRIATGAMGRVHGCYTELLMDAMQILGVIQDLNEPRGEFGTWRDIY